MSLFRGRDKGTKARQPSQLRRDYTCGHGRPVVRNKVDCGACAGEEWGMSGTYRNGKKISDWAI